MTRKGLQKQSFDLKIFALAINMTRNTLYLVPVVPVAIFGGNVLETY